MGRCKTQRDAPSPWDRRHRDTRSRDRHEDKAVSAVPVLRDGLSRFFTPRDTERRPGTAARRRRRGHDGETRGGGAETRGGGAETLGAGSVARLSERIAGSVARRLYETITTHLHSARSSSLSSFGKPHRGAAARSARLDDAERIPAKVGRGVLAKSDEGGDVLTPAGNACGKRRRKSDGRDPGASPATAADSGSLPGNSLAKRGRLGGRNSGINHREEPPENRDIDDDDEEGAVAGTFGSKARPDFSPRLNGENAGKRGETRVLRQRFPREPAARRVTRAAPGVPGEPRATTPRKSPSGKSPSGKPDGNADSKPANVSPSGMLRGGFGAAGVPGEARAETQRKTRGESPAKSLPGKSPPAKPDGDGGSKAADGKVRGGFGTSGVAVASEAARGIPNGKTLGKRDLNAGCDVGIRGGGVDDDDDDDVSKTVGGKTSGKFDGKASARRGAETRGRRGGDTEETQAGDAGETPRHRGWRKRHGETRTYAVSGLFDGLSHIYTTQDGERRNKFRPNYLEATRGVVSLRPGPHHHHSSTSPSASQKNDGAGELKAGLMSSATASYTAASRGSHDVSSEDLEMFKVVQERAAKHLSPGGDSVSPSVIEMGRYEIQTLHRSALPASHSRCARLFVCEFCLCFLCSRDSLRRHATKCLLFQPPAPEIYRHGRLSVYEVDGRVSSLYCRNLCLLAMLFLRHKTLCVDVELFLFYVLTTHDHAGNHLVAYFSKEKQAKQGYNLSCILTLPQYQRLGYGHFLISLSYLLSRREGRPGSPEKPLSDLGRLAYSSYWREALTEALTDTLLASPPRPPAASKAWPPRPGEPQAPGSDARPEGEDLGDGQAEGSGTRPKGQGLGDTRARRSGTRPEGQGLGDRQAEGNARPHGLRSDRQAERSGNRPQGNLDDGQARRSGTRPKGQGLGKGQAEWSATGPQGLRPDAGGRSGERQASREGVGPERRNFPSEEEETTEDDEEETGRRRGARPRLARCRDRARAGETQAVRPGGQDDSGEGQDEGGGSGPGRPGEKQASGGRETRPRSPWRRGERPGRGESGEARAEGAGSRPEVSIASLSRRTGMTPGDVLATLRSLGSLRVHNGRVAILHPHWTRPPANHRPRIRLDESRLHWNPRSSPSANHGASPGSRDRRLPRGAVHHGSCSPPPPVLSREEPQCVVGARRKRGRPRRKGLLSEPPHSPPSLEGPHHPADAYTEGIPFLAEVDGGGGSGGEEAEEEGGHTPPPVKRLRETRGDTGRQQQPPFATKCR